MENAIASHNIDRVARTFRTIKADANGNLPTQIEVLKAGMWDTPNHGMFMITIDDIQEMIANFKAGIGLPGQGQIGAPIDFGHDSHEEAAGWITGLSATDGGNTLVADVTWTSSGIEALTGLTYRCFSPEFYPGSRGGWEDPESYGTYIPNVLVGGGLTNIPLFKGLKPIMASAKTGDEARDVIYISESQGKEKTMTIEELRVKDATALTDEEKTFLQTNIAELSEDEKTKFGLVQTENKEEPVVPTPVTPTVEAPAETPAPVLAEPVLASIKSGESMVVKASEWKEMQEAGKAYRREKAEQVVTAHAARGAIKADQVNKWVDKLLVDSSVGELLNDLPSNALLASEIGSSEKASAVISAAEEIRTKANEAVKASREAGREISITQAILDVRKSEPELAKRYDEEIKSN